ncbi:MAG: hypothetical protein QOK48_3151, partial [Blastocatellia bacterium]|nr:hypothetical protein [Blastocatellia bacterium]
MRPLVSKSSSFTRRSVLASLSMLLVLSVLAGLAYMKFGRRPAPLDQTLTARFPVLATSLASQSTEFKRSVRRVNGQDVAGLLAHPVNREAFPSKSESGEAMPAGLKAVEQEALRLAAERNTSDELAAFFPNQFSEPFVVEGARISVVVRPLEALPAQASIENGKVVYRDAYRETDSLNAVSAGRSEEFLYLRSPNAPRRFEYELSDISGVKEINLENGAIRFKSEAGAGLQIEAPWLVDVSGKRREDVVRWELGAADANGKRRLSLVVEDNAELSYPLVIDPSWIPSGMITPRDEHTATLLLNGKVLVAGGSTNGGRTTSAELYDPATGAWTSTGSLSNTRVGHTATLLPDGRVLVAGGGPTAPMPGGLLSAVAIAELYNPATGTWRPTGSLVKARDHHTATLLPNGKVLITGGQDPAFTNPTNRLIGTAELYDPFSETWSSTGSLGVARESHTATLLPNGKLL